MKIRHLIPLFVLCFNTAWADFSNTRVFSHPLYAEANEPFLLEIRGDWSSDCHPGEQNPVISGYTGDTVLIAGKGHETVQIVGREERPFDDRQVAAAAMQRRD